MLKWRAILLATTLLLAGCAVNPVTGKNEFSLVSEQQELAIGAQQYAPARQAQGGDYVADPELANYVDQVGQRLAAVSDRKLPYEFKVLNNSVPNAWALPGGKISINRGLLTELQSEAELAAVLGHEIVHAAAGHGAQSMSKGMLLQAGAAGAALATQGTEYAGLAQLGAGLGAQLITQKFGRDAERESDHYGMLYMARAGYDPQGAVDLQRTFVKLSEGKRQDWINGLFASHPPSPERVQNNLEFLAGLPQGGDKGVERFRTKTAHLLQTKPAYAAYDQGREALTKKDAATAERLARQAIALEPKEALFYGLLGDIEQHNRQLDDAVAEYDQATRLNPDFYYFYLQRGRAKEQLKLADQAESDLEQSVKLLPTAEAYSALGNLAQQAGRLEEAKTYYAKVAGSQSALGQQAFAALVDLDLKDNPAKYLSLQTGLDAQGRIIARIGNPTPRDVEKIVLSVQYLEADGKRQRFIRAWNGILPAGRQQLFDLELSALIPKDQLKTLEVEVSAAQPVR
jgi:predicted Zn-dependent protease